jgi:hypothetical protein
MTNIREWEKLKYYDPEKILLGLRDIAVNFPFPRIPSNLTSQRKRELRRYGESRQCALFCYGISKVRNIKIQYADYEKSDYDFVGVYPEEGYLNYIPIQMKELVPEQVNPDAQLENELKKLQKYTDSQDLCVAIHLNRNESFDFKDINLPELNIRELWFFGAKDRSQSEWRILGDILNNPKVYEFFYPTTKA